MAITALPSPPDRASPSTFAAKGDALLSALPTFVTEANALQADVNAKQVSAATQVTLATTQANNAAASATAAAASATASIWVSGTTYAIGNVRFSPINFQNYRRKTAGAGTIDPSTDSTNWVLLATIPTVTADAGNVLVSDGTNLSWTPLPSPKSWTQITETGTFTAPSAGTYRFYAFGQGGAANAVAATSASSGGGGGCAYGDISLIKGQVATITISAGVTTVTVAGTVVLTAGKGGDATAGVAGAAGTASKHATLIANGGAFSGGAGATASGTVSCAATGGTTGSVLGAGVAGIAIGTSTAWNSATASAPGWGGVGASIAANGGANVLSGGSIGGAGAVSPASPLQLVSSGSTSNPLLARTKFNAFTDPLLSDQNGAGSYYANGAVTAVGGQGSSGVGSIPANGIGGGGGASLGINVSAGAFGCAGGAMTFYSGTNLVGASGYGAGAGAASIATTASGSTAAGAAICLIYQ